jgi:protein gp37
MPAISQSGFAGCQGMPYEQGFDFRLVPKNLELPLHWRQPRKIFVNSMSDTFHKDAPDEYIVRVAEVMAEADWHTYQVLTKRSERMRDLLNSELKFVAKLPHIWWGGFMREPEARLTAYRTSPSRACGCKVCIPRTHH